MGKIKQNIKKKKHPGGAQRAGAGSPGLGAGLAGVSAGRSRALGALRPPFLLGMHAQVGPGHVGSQGRGPADRARAGRPGPTPSETSSTGGSSASPSCPTPGILGTADLSASDADVTRRGAPHSPPPTRGRTPSYSLAQRSLCASPIFSYFLCLLINSSATSLIITV